MIADILARYSDHDAQKFWSKIEEFIDKSTDVETSQFIQRVSWLRNDPQLARLFNDVVSKRSVKRQTHVVRRFHLYQVMKFNQSSQRVAKELSIWPSIHR